MGAPVPRAAKGRKALMAAMQQKRQEDQERIKAIQFPLPDLKGPGGNAFALLGQAAALMKKHDVPEAERSRFHTEATSGNYEHLLRTIGEWFTPTVAVVQHVPIDASDFDSLVSGRMEPGEDEDMEASEMAAREQYEDFEDSEEPEVLDLRGLTPVEQAAKIAAHQQKKAFCTPGNPHNPQGCDCGEAG